MDHEILNTFCGKMRQHTICSLDHRKQILVTHNWKCFSSPGSSKESENKQMNEPLYSPVKVCQVLALSSAVRGLLFRSHS